MLLKPTTPKRMKGFTLLELIVVVMIVSIMSFLLFTSIAQKEKKKNKALSPATLPSTFRQEFKGKGEVELFCINQCKECYIVIDNTITAYEGQINLGEELEVEMLDKDNRFYKVNDFGRIKDEKVCFRYHLYANGSTTKMVISNKQGIYFLPSFFGKAQEVNDTEEAKTLWVKEEYSLDDSGAFY